VVGVVARARTAEGLNADGLTTLLIARKDDISRLAPAGLAGVFGLSGIAELGASRADTATGNAPNEQLWAAWEQRGKDSGRPPWGWLLLGIAALSLVYWLWGRETEVTPRRVSTPPQMSTLALELLPPIPTVGLPDGTVLSLTTTGYGQENLLATNEAGDEPQTIIWDWWRRSERRRAAVLARSSRRSTSSTLARERRPRQQHDM
jgi:hypothetical protein